MESRKLQELYANPDQSKGENIKLWEEEELASYREYTEKLYENLRTSGILPQDMEGFVFLGVSSNKADKEKLLAELLDKGLSGKVFNKKPLIIAADFFGESDQSNLESQGFTPGFNPDEKPKLANINFSYLSADAYHIPLDDKSINVLFDRLGVLHHASDNFIIGPALANKVLEILKHWDAKLKPGGSILLDASALPRGPEKIDSTIDKLEHYITDNFNKNSAWDNFLKGLGELGFETSFIGSEANRLWRLHKIEV